MGMYYYYAYLVNHGAVPNRDFQMVYGILFPYLLAITEWVWHHPFALILLFQWIEFASVYAIFTQKNAPLSLGAFLAYALNPITVVWIWLGLQNQVMCLIPVAAVIALRNETGRSLLFALGLAVSKVFALWTILPALLGQRLKSKIVFVAALLAIYVPFVIMGASPLSFKASEITGEITEDAKVPGVESLFGYMPLGSMETEVTHGVLIVTAGLLLATLLWAFVMRFKLDAGKIDADARFQRELIFTAIFATLLTLIYQAFATYTAPDYLLVAVFFAPLLVKAKFWTNGDHALFVIMCYLQSTIYLLWYHLAEFGIVSQRSSTVFLVLLVLGNLFYDCLLSSLCRSRHHLPSAPGGGSLFGQIAFSNGLSMISRLYGF